ncbi:MAG: NADH-ubiquinone oxidoreductase-F iron-sulfur binding region domain-containing protein, partial [Nocardioidaceae bacterium]
LHGRAAYVALGTRDEPGTSLLTLTSPTGGVLVMEVPHGTAWEDIVTIEESMRPVLLGGYHGTWAAAGALRGRALSRAELAEHGLSLGAGVVMPLRPGMCPLEETARIVRYLAEESAGRCGPCLNGLPALATAVERIVAGLPDPGVEKLAGYLVGRGACAHPDGTVRMVRSALLAFPDEIRAHSEGTCLMSRLTGASV